ncbi:MAG: hypothetical protein WCC87_22765 [Candidatus Korobacteraceae bacterium]
MAEISVGIYHGRALQLANAMKLCRDDLPSYAWAAALLAVHSAISYCDAVLFKLNGQRSHSQDHGQAITAVTKACKKMKIQTDGIKHLDRLVSAKTDISYGDEQVDNQRVEVLCVAAERFQAWAERVLYG